MKCLKQAAKRIVTAGLTLCLLLPCSVPASAALQTPAWMQAWANTRTAGVIAQLEKDQFTAKIKVDGVEGILVADHRAAGIVCSYAGVCWSAGLVEWNR